MKHIMTVAVLLLASFAASANELDNEAAVTNKDQRARELPQTVIVRVNEQSKEVQVALLPTPLDESKIQPKDIEKLEFKTVATGKSYAKTEFAELDTETSSESWYFYYGWNYGYGYYAPYFNYWGYNYWYTPYYSYPYYGWAYNYYRPFYYGWW